MTGGVGGNTRRRQLGAILVGIDGLMLSAMVAKNTQNIFHAADGNEIKDEDNDA